jgi:hypothetical protein
LKHCIVIGATLKPVDDARHFHKIALSLGQTNKYELNIIGRAIKNIPQAKNITFLPLFGLKNSNLKRLVSPFIYLRKTWQIKPDLQIICSWELLPAAIICKFFRGGKLIYDIQENYIKNVRFLGKDNWIIKKLKSFIISIFQTISWPFIDYFFLAEQTYETEFKLKSNSYKILENKSLRIDKKSDNSSKFNCLFTGTFGQAQGIWDVLLWAEKASQLDNNFQLTVIGHCPSETTFTALQKKAGGKDYIDLQGQTEPIDYNTILENISKADFGLIAYPPNPANQDKFPSKLYEYLAAQLPVFILQPNPKWEAIIEQYDAGISSRTYTSIISQIQAFKSRKFYLKSVNNSELFWESNESKLLDSVAKLLKQ